MDKPKFNDFLVVGRFVLCASFCVLLTPAWPAFADDSGILAQQTTENQPARSAAIQKIQRLLKLLADRYPGRYHSVDPGSLDGVYGEGTKSAIRKFRAIAGLVKDPRPDTQLAPTILAELAEMTAADPDTLQVISPLGCTQTAAGEECLEGLTADTADTPGASVAGKAAEPANPASESGKTAPAPAPSTQSSLNQNAAPDVKPDPIQAPVDQPRTETELRYFVQVASLRSPDAAQKEWTRIEAENHDTLRGAQNQIERVEISGRGIFHRVLIGPLLNRDDAKMLCGSLKQNGQTCMVMQRNLADLRIADPRQVETSKGGAEMASTPLRTETSPPASSPKTAIPAAPDQDRRAGQSEGAKSAPATPLPAPPADPAATSAATQPGPSVPATPAAPIPTAPSVGASSSQTPQNLVRAPDTSALDDARPARALQMKTLPPDAAKAVPAEDLGDHLATTARDSAQAQAEAKSQTQAKVAAPAPPRSLNDRAIDFARKVWRKLRGLLAPAVLAFILIGGFLLYSAKRRKRRAAIAALTFPNGEATERFPLPGMEEENSGEIRSLSALEDAFDSQRLQDSRRVRDAFLREVLFDEADNPPEIRNRESAIRINGRLKRLLTTEPERYKSIFLNLIFLSKVGAALNRKDITFEQLNGHFSREFDLLQSYFKIHLLELDDRHRIRKYLPGLFYCLHFSQLQKGPQSVHFSAA
jgi:peptidoglycan hydrolase-like protein with peptidoglycan-binding domain